MTIPFMAYLNRTGLELDEAQDVDMLTSKAQAAKSWIQLQDDFRARGGKKIAKCEAANIIITETFKLDEELDESEKVMLLKGAVSVFAYQYQENLADQFDIYKLESNLIKANKSDLDLQFEKSTEASKNKGFFEKLLN